MLARESVDLTELEILSRFELGARNAELGGRRSIALVGMARPTLWIGASGTQMLLLSDGRLADNTCQPETGNNPVERIGEGMQSPHQSWVRRVGLVGPVGQDGLLSNAECGVRSQVEC